MNESEASFEQLLYTFHRMQHACTRYELEKRGLVAASPPILLAVLHATKRGPVTQRRIADLLGVAPPTVAVSIKRMEQAGLLSRRPDAADLRKNRISLTDKGREVTEACISAGREVYREIAAGLTDGEIETLRGLYARMIRNMIELGARRPGMFRTDRPGKEEAV